MNLKTATDWLTYGALILPLFILAWSAWQYVMLQKKIEEQRRFENFFLVVEKSFKIGEVPLGAAALYELRKYPEYKEFTVRYCQWAMSVLTDKKQAFLRTEYQLTLEYFEKNQP
jgi:hypothetical protein